MCKSIRKQINFRDFEKSMQMWSKKLDKELGTKTKNKLVIEENHKDLFRLKVNEAVKKSSGNTHSSRTEVIHELMRKLHLKQLIARHQKVNQMKKTSNKEENIYETTDVHGRRENSFTTFKNNMSHHEPIKRKCEKSENYEGVKRQATTECLLESPKKSKPSSTSVVRKPSSSSRKLVFTAAKPRNRSTRRDIPLWKRVVVRQHKIALHEYLKKREATKLHVKTQVICV